MSCFVELNYFCMSLTPPTTPSSADALHVGDDVVTMAAKLGERRREERDREKESAANANPEPKSSAGERKKRAERKKKGRGEDEGERRTRGWIEDETLMSVSMSPDPLISSPLSMWLLISLSLNL